MHTSLTIGIVLFLSGIPEENHIYTADSPAPATLDIGFILSQMSAGSIFCLNLALVTKAISSCSSARGVLLGAQGFIIASGVLVINGLGGQLYDINKRDPFIIVLTSELILLALIAVLRLTNQLHI